MKKAVVLIICLMLIESLVNEVFSQVCMVLGQNPITAYPVCGATSFTKLTVPLCGNRSIPTPCNTTTTYSDKNPFWYKFTCYTAGKLGFVITPAVLSDDYDWELFDITGVDPMDVYSNRALIVSANWSGSYGLTGTNNSAKNSFECASMPSAGISAYSTMPDLIVGHDYLLLVSHFDDSQTGYSLSFQGGTASITNPVNPVLQSAYAVCDGTKIVVALNKKIKCESLALDGTDFSISGTVPNSIKSALGKGCELSFDMDSVELTLNTILSPGTYTVSSTKGSDLNTLIDNCDNELAIGLTKNLNFSPAAPTPMDSMLPVICLNDTLQLVFSKPINCTSIAADGTDFFITGPSSVIIKSANGICSNSVSSTIQVLLTKAIKVNGTYQIHLQNGSDNNTLIDECGESSMVGSVLGFNIKNVDSANFSYVVKTGCKIDTLLLKHNGNNGTIRWNWKFGTALTSNIQNPVIGTNAFGLQHVKLSVFNGYCTDTTSADIDLPNYTVKANFISSDTICTKDSLIVIDQSSANTISWNWNFGNGQFSNLQQPLNQSYLSNNTKKLFRISLIVKNNYNCIDSSFKTLTVLPNCYIDIPSAFTPNGDGLNDNLYPLNAIKAINLNFKVYNRLGQVIFETTDWTKKWDGRINGQLQPSGTYVWTLDYTHVDTGKVYALKGTTVLIR